MTASTENPTAREPRRAGRELVLEVVFRPVAAVFVPFLRRAKLSPPAVVLANAATGLVAAAALGGGRLVAAAFLLQAKTLLDNMDGELARATGKVTLVGRYLDTLADLAVNAALFAALAYTTGQWALAVAAFLALTLVLAADYNATELYREASGSAMVAPRAVGSRLERALEATYATLLGPLDRATRALVRRRLPSAATYDAFTVTALANLGLTTQLVVLGVCLVLDVPAAYLWFCLACLAALVPLHLRAERRARVVSGAAA
jgi:phosphatidylglycerophosphate synthase